MKNQFDHLRSNEAKKVITVNQQNSYNTCGVINDNNNICTDTNHTIHVQTGSKTMTKSNHTPFGKYMRLDGSMSQSVRATAVQSFTEEDDVTILLISLK
jgi:hypothetical protein